MELIEENKLMREVLTGIAEACNCCGSRADLTEMAAECLVAVGPAAQLEAETLTAADYEEALASQRDLVRQIDVMLNGEAGAAKQASLCDLMGQLKERLQPEGEVVPEGVYWNEEADNFYDAEYQAGMGNHFYTTWYKRRRDFPVAQRQAGDAA